MTDLDLSPRDDDIVVEAGEVALIEEVTLKRWQATITTTHEYNKSLENLVIEAPDKTSIKDVAYAAVKEYMVKRFMHGVTRLIFRAVLDGVKPKIVRHGQTKYVIGFWTPDGTYLNEYTVQLIEI